MNELAVLDKAATMLAAITDLPEVLTIRDKAEAARTYIKASGQGLLAQNHAARIKLLAEKRAGELLKELEIDGKRISSAGGRKRSHDVTVSLSDLGVTKMQSSRYQQVAKLSEKDLRNLADECDKSSKELTQALAIKTATGAHVGHNAGENEWYTPKEYIEAAIEVMGGIDLDPASTDEANAIVGASRFFDEADNGLERKWTGRIWLNPPYAQPLIGLFANKLMQSVRDEYVTQACILVNNATETQWFQSLAEVASAICFPAGRVKFWHPERKSAPLQGQAVLYCGESVRAFVNTFKTFGFVMRR
jgi:ParB family chromosome partitioning protein